MQILVHMQKVARWSREIWRGQRTYRSGIKYSLASVCVNFVIELTMCLFVFSNLLYFATKYVAVRILELSVDWFIVLIDQYF